MKNPHIVARGLRQESRSVIYTRNNVFHLPMLNALSRGTCEDSTANHAEWVVNELKKDRGRMRYKYFVRKECLTASTVALLVEKEKVRQGTMNEERKERTLTTGSAFMNVLLAAAGRKRARN